MAERRARKAADRMAKLILKAVSEHCADGMRQRTIDQMDDAAEAYLKLVSEAEYKYHLVKILS